MEYCKDRVSLIIPCYNGQGFIEQSFRHILAQTYREVEVVFVNDGSKDNSLQEARKWEPVFAQAGMKLICLDQENGGAAAAVENGMKTMSGEFFELLDVDDFIYPENLSAKVEYLRANPEVAFVRTDGEIYNEEKGAVVSSFTTREDEKQCTGIYEDLLFGRTYNWPGSYLIRTEKFIQANGSLEIYHSRYGQNMQVLLPMAEKYPCGFVPICGSRYIEYKKSVSHKKTYIENKKLLNGFEDIRVKVLSQHGLDDPELMQRLQDFYARLGLLMAYNFREKEEAKRIYAGLRSKTKKDKLLFLRTQNGLVDKAFCLLIRLMHKK